MAYSLPLIGLLQYHAYIMNRSEKILVKPSVSTIHELLEGHDRVLLLSCGGIFAISIFRLFAAVGILFRISSVEREEIVLASYALIYSIFKMYLFWHMTSFILIVQRQLIQCSTEAKAVLVCLLYVVVLNATNWFVNIVEVNSWIEFQAYFGPTRGEFLGALMEPFESLYGLHATIIAYEAYKSLYSEWRFVDVAN